MCLASRPPQLALGEDAMAGARDPLRGNSPTYALTAEWLDRAIGEPVLAGEGGGGCPRGEPELPQDVGDVAIDGVLAEHKPLSDVAIREAIGNQREHLELARAQAAERRVDRGSGKRDRRLLELPEH